jgi:hypothetical protein
LTPLRPPPRAAPRRRRADKLRALLLSRARADFQLLPQLRASLREATTTARRARFGLGLLGWGAAAAQLVRRQVLLNELQAARMGLAAADASSSALASADDAEPPFAAAPYPRRGP